MRITLAPDMYAEWSLGLRTINLYQDRGDYQAPIDCISFGYDKPDNSTTQLEMLAVILRHLEPECPLCGEDCEQRPVDCCDCLRWDCEVAQDDEVRVCATLADDSTPCEHHVYLVDEQPQPETFEVSICPDCLYYDAYGDSTWVNAGVPLPDPAPMSLLDGFDIGFDNTDHECEGHFSWSPCDGCGSTLGGTRYCCTAVKEN